MLLIPPPLVPLQMATSFKDTEHSGYKFSVDMWDGDVRRYKLNDEEIGGIRCFMNFPDARDFSVRQLEKKLRILENKLEKIRGMKATEAT